MSREAKVAPPDSDARLSPEVRALLRERLGCEVRFAAPLAGYSTYRIGGPAAALVFPRHAEDVGDVLRLARDTGTPFLAVGLGSNLLFDDAGFGGIVIRVAKTMAGVERSADGATWRVGAGLPTPQLARRTAQAGCGGVHRLVGVPGAVGGGVFMNAGAHGQDFAQVVTSVDVVDGDGTLRTVAGTDVPWVYRRSGIEGVVVSTTLTLPPADPATLQREVRLYLRRRREGTPFDQPCCGSVFRNPSPEETASLRGPGPHTAGRLIDAAGLKGYRVGGAEVSPLHANYIVNVGGGTAADVRAVAREVQRRVEDQFGIHLALEVRVIPPG